MTPDPLIKIDYQYPPSFLVAKEEGDYIKELKLFVEDVHSEPVKFVGELHCKLIYLQEAIDEDVDIYELFDHYEYTHRHAENFYDYDYLTFNTKVLKEFEELEYRCNRICIIETVGIVPKYRGQQLGKKIFDNLVWNLGSDYELYIIQPYPLQFEWPENHRELLSKLDLENLEKRKLKAKQSLTEYYTTWGFKKIKGIKDLLFYCPIKNHNLDQSDIFK